MSKFSEDGKQAMLEALAGVITHLSLHDDDPGENGANELAGGDPAYARKAVAFGSFATDAIPIDGAVEFDVPASATVSYVGFWEDGDPDVFHGYGTLADSEVFAGQGTFTVTTDTKLQIQDPA